MSTRAVLLLILASIFHALDASLSCSNITLISSQLDALLAVYERERAPAAPVNVQLALDVRHATVNSGDSVVRLLADLRMSWEDKRLSWNASEWDCDTALADAERLWLPDVELLNAAAGGAREGSLRAHVTSDSWVSWIIRIDVAVPLAFDLTSWPKDYQTVFYKFGSREHAVDEIDLTIGDFKYATVWETGNWEIMSVEGSHETLGFGAEKRSIAQWEVSLKRRAAAHALAAATVFATTVLLLVAAAVMPPVSRPPMCACAAAIAALWLISTLFRLPGSYTYPTSLSLMAALSGAAAASCAAAALVVRVASSTRLAPAPLRALLAAVPGWCAATAPDSRESSGHAESATWAAAAQLLDNVLRALLGLTLFVLVCLYR